MTLLLNFFIRYVVLWLRDFVWKVAENQGDHFEWADLVFSKILSLLWQSLNSIGQILNV